MLFEDGEHEDERADELPSDQHPPADRTLRELRDAARSVGRDLGAPGWPPR